MTERKKLREMLKRHEGLRLKAYVCPEGKLTIGYGHTGDDVYKGMVISKEKAEELLNKDIRNAEDDANKFGWFDSLNPSRQDVIIEMLFNIGLPKFLGFKRMISALEEGWYTNAAEEMLSSKWHSQVKGRARELAAIMSSGKYFDEV